MQAQIAIVRIDDQRNGSFIAHVNIHYPDVGTATFEIEVVAAGYGDVRKEVFRLLADYGNAIATTAFAG